MYRLYTHCRSDSKDMLANIRTAITNYALSLSKKDLYFSPTLLWAYFGKYIGLPSRKVYIVGTCVLFFSV